MSKKNKNKSWKMGPACRESHPTLELLGQKVHGGSCLSPVKGYDIYVGLDMGMKRRHAPFPWHPADEVLLSISDGDIPLAPEEFWNLIGWLIEKLKEGKSVHVGCVGGHGRTGMVLAALVSEIGLSDDPIAWVREHYCEKAVETDKQIKFLVKFWKCKPAKPTRKATVVISSGKDWDWMGGSGSAETFLPAKWESHGTKTGKSDFKPPKSKLPKCASPVRTSNSIWGKPLMKMSKS